MSTRGIPTRSQGPLAKRGPSVGPVRSAKSPTGEIAKPSQLPTPKPQPKNGNTVFDAEPFLTRTGLGRKVVSLKKNEVAYAQGDPADTIFYVQRGQLRVTVVSANGKEATIALVSAGEFLGENCMVSPRPIRLATATAMTECALLRISKAEMVRALHQEPAFSNVFVSLSDGSQRSHPGRSGGSAFQFQRKAAGEDSVIAGAVRQGKQAGDGSSEGQPGGIGGDDRHNPVPREFFHESLQKTGVHRI